MRYFISIILVTFSCILYGQEHIKIKEVRGKAFVEFVSSVDTFFINNSGYFGMSFYVVSNGYGIANIPETHGP